ncbi:MAG: hypothetical protein R3F07_20215 [Opitutaceae bacterium]
MNRFPLLRVGLALVLHCVVHLQAQPDPFAHQATIVTTTGKVYRGWLDGYRDDRVRLRIAADRGEAIYQFAPDEIRSLVFPDADRAEEVMTPAESITDDHVLAILEEVWAGRAAYLPALDRANRGPLLAYAEGLLKAGRPMEAIARARRMSGLDLDESETERMATVLLLGYEAAGLHEEAAILAENWCRKHRPSGPSVIGWAVLVRQGLRDQNWESVLWLGLHPVAFGCDAGAIGLDHCYAAVISASLETDDAATAVTLFNEMQERGIEWPEGEPLFAETLRLIETALRPETPPEEPALDEEPVGPPIPDPWLTLEAVRRVLAQPGS